MPDQPYEDVQIEGHLIDSLMMPHIMDQIMDLDGEFEMLTFEVGRMKDDPSHAVMRIFGATPRAPRRAAQAITEFGVVAVKPQDAVLEGCRHGRRLSRPLLLDHEPRDVRARRRRVGRVQHPGDGLRHPRRSGSPGAAETVAMSDVRAGDRFVVGHRGIRVLPLERPRERHTFEFMNSAVSSEKPKAQIVREVARILRHGARRAGWHRRRRPRRRAHRRGAAPRAPLRDGLPHRAVRRQRGRHARRRGGPLRHLARRAPRHRRGRPAATSTTCAPSTPSARRAASPKRSGRAC